MLPVFHLYFDPLIVLYVIFKQLILTVCQNDNVDDDSDDGDDDGYDKDDDDDDNHCMTYTGNRDHPDPHAFSPHLLFPPPYPPSACR